MATLYQLSESYIKVLELAEQLDEEILRDTLDSINEAIEYKAENLEMAETGSGVRTSRHWKAAANIEFYYKEIQKGFDQMRELDWQTNWSKKLHQDRFKFVEKYREILDEYMEECRCISFSISVS